MKSLKELFSGKDRKSVYNLLLMLSVGITLMVLGKVFFPKETEINPGPIISSPMDIITPSEPVETYAERLEKRLADILSEVENAGRVRVLLTLSAGKELVVASDIRAEDNATAESDAEGGTRTISEAMRDEQTVRLRQPDGSDQPLVLKEIEPVIAGALIIAEGGGDIFVKDALIRAAYTVLGIEPHRVQVLTMRQ